MIPEFAQEATILQRYTKNMCRVLSDKILKNDLIFTTDMQISLPLCQPFRHFVMYFLLST